MLARSVPDRKAPAHLPDSTQLTAIGNHQVSLQHQPSSPSGMHSVTGDEGDKSEVEPPHVQQPPPSNTANPPPSVPTGADSIGPSQMQFYEPAAHDIIERAKQFSHCDAATINAFPLCMDFTCKVVAYIDEAIDDRKSRGFSSQMAGGPSRVVVSRNWPCGSSGQEPGGLALEWDWDRLWASSQLGTLLGELGELELCPVLSRPGPGWTDMFQSVHIHVLAKINDLAVYIRHWYTCFAKFRITGMSLTVDISVSVEIVGH
ncbi:hypothetical protein BDN67DRAFT_982179 [Paxillus ammoniavirescens]|nr:hypothetical protein BDN67DRAFT_982179 [Paxillus ammoniavirescens]